MQNYSNMHPDQVQESEGVITEQPKKLTKPVHYAKKGIRYESTDNIVLCVFHCRFLCHSITRKSLIWYTTFIFRKGHSYHSQLQDMSRHCSFTSDEEFEMSERKRYNHKRFVFLKVNLKINSCFLKKYG